MLALTTGEADTLMRVVDTLRNSTVCMGQDAIDFKLRLDFADWMCLVSMRENIGLRLK